MASVMSRPFSASAPSSSDVRRAGPAVPSTTRCQAAVCEATVPVNAQPAASTSKYAVIDIGGMRQVVQEGIAYFQPSALCPQAEQLPGSSKPKLRFNKVVALRDNGRFSWGKPYVPGVLVEAELLEEFCGPIPAELAAESTSSAAASGSVPHAMMAKYMVTRIAQSS